MHIEPWNENLVSVIRTDLGRELKAPTEKKLLFVFQTCRMSVPRLESEQAVSRLVCLGRYEAGSCLHTVESLMQESGCNRALRKATRMRPAGQTIRPGGTGTLPQLKAC